MVGKYTKLEDAYASVIKALNHASLALNHRLRQENISRGVVLNDRKCVSMGAAGARTRRSLGHHLLHPLILRLLVLCAPAVLRLRALQDAPAPANPNF